RLRSGLDLALDLTGAQPALTGTITAETLPLPLPLRTPGPLPIGLLHGWQAKLRVKAAQLLGSGMTLLRDGSATLQLQHSVLSLEQLSGQLGGGALAGSLSLDAGQQPPALTVQAKLTGAAIDGPVLRLPIDLSGGNADLSLSLRAVGYSTHALTASLVGSVQASVRDGMLSGFDLAGLRDLLKLPGADPSEASLHNSLEGGQTAFHHLLLQGQVAHGILSLDTASLSGAAGGADATGTVTLPDATADLHLVLHPAIPQGPSIAMLVSGALGAPRRTPELAGVARWRHARGH
ncbi:MAG TPA: AsmA-like C-terminal region-containing protein, partial [Acetobacteraceae bacterium]|nr:AsmA-like C-terminal region-containing protein [Acetobacteraceae bacterium]